MLRRIGLKTRVILPASFLMLVSIIVVVGYQATNITSITEDIIKSKTEELAYRHANELDNGFDQALDAARTLAQSIEGMLGAEVKDRDLVNSMLKNVLDQNSEYGVSTSLTLNLFGLQKHQNIKGLSK